MPGMKSGERLTATAFVRELVQGSMTRAHLAVVAGWAALMLAVQVALCATFVHGWRSAAVAVLAVAFAWALVWRLLGVPVVQRWVRGGDA